MWLSICIVAAFLVISVTAVAFVMHRPSVEVDPPFPTDTSETTESDVGVSTDPYTRKDGYYTFLLAGVDDVSMNTDVLMLASLDTKSGEIHIVQIPRDTFINKEVGGYTNVNRVNAVFTAAYNRQRNQGIGANEAKKRAMEDLRTRLSEALCVTIDEYVLINTKGFRNIIDAVGGVWYDVPCDMDYDDPDQDLFIHLKAGYQHLDGSQCEQLIRFRDGYATGDIERVSLRGNFMVAALKQVKSNITVGSMLNMIPSLIDNVITSMSVADILSYTRLVYSVGDEGIAVRTMGGSTVQNPETGLWIYYCLNRRAALSDINECLNVYVGDISDEIFDRAGFFTDSRNASNAYINDYYSS